MNDKDKLFEVLWNHLSNGSSGTIGKAEAKKLYDATIIVASPDETATPAQVARNLPSKDQETSGELWRELLWIRHGCAVTSLYADDGERQCRRCGVDFKRWSPEQMRTRWDQLAEGHSQRLPYLATAEHAKNHS